MQGWKFVLVSFWMCSNEINNNVPNKNCERKVSNVITPQVLSICHQNHLTSNSRNLMDNLDNTFVASADYTQLCDWWQSTSGHTLCSPGIDRIESVFFYLSMKENGNKICKWNQFSRYIYINIYSLTCTSLRILCTIIWSDFRLQY